MGGIAKVDGECRSPTYPTATLETFRQSLIQSGICEPSQNKISISLLLSVSQCLRRIYEEESQDSLRQQQKSRRLETSRALSSTSFRYIQALRPQWERVRRKLLQGSRSHQISLSEFRHAVLREGGLTISPADIQELWRYSSLRSAGDGGIVVRRFRILIQQRL